MQQLVYLHHVSLNVLSMRHSVQFYQKLFGVQIVLELLQDDGRKIIHALLPGTSMIIEFIEVERLIPVHGVHLGFSTQQFEEVLKLLWSNNVTFERNPFVIGKERVVLIKDPDGYLIEINDGLEVY